MKRSHFWHFGRTAFINVDILIGLASVILAQKLTPYVSKEILYGIIPNPYFLDSMIIYTVIFVFSVNVFGLHNPLASYRMVGTLSRAIVASVLAVSIYLVLTAFFSFELTGRYIMVQLIVYSSLGVMLSRALIWNRAFRSVKRLLVYGDEAGYIRSKEEIGNVALPLEVIGYANRRQSATKATKNPGFVDLGHESLLDYCRRNDIDELVTIPNELGRAERIELMECTARGVKVMDLQLFYERNLFRIYSESLNEDWFWSQDPLHYHPIYRSFKVLIDKFFSILGILCCLPVWPIIALIIKCQDGGPILYSQTRAGLYNQPFSIYKFRSMRVDAEKDGAQWAQKGDNRVTWFGQLLRKTRFDETPQFFNVLRGDMSFIGPRPERPDMIAQIEKEVPFYSYRHLTKPGITGWAQINYPYGSSIEDARMKLTYDLYYLKNASFTLDLQVVLGTILAMVQGAR